MNLVIVNGYLTNDPSVSESESGTVIAKGTIAVQEYFEENANFINYTAFNAQAEFLEKYAKKGHKMLMKGRWQTGSYTNKDGVKVYTNTLIVDSVESSGRNDSYDDEVEEETSKRQTAKRTTNSRNIKKKYDG